MSSDLSDSVKPELETGKTDQKALTHGQLIRYRFMRNRLAVVSLIVIGLFYLIAIPAEFTAPYGPTERFMSAISVPPQPVRIVDEEGQWHLPFVYGMEQRTNPRTFKREYVVDTSQRYGLQLFPQTQPYRLFVLELDRKLFGFEGASGHLLGTDNQGRDMLSRTIHGGRVSLLIGLIGVAISMVIGTIAGIVSGLLGGWVDSAIQRLIEVLLSFPTIPLWMAFSAAVPSTWSPLNVFFVMSIIISFIGWASLGRVVRGITLSLKNEEYVEAARLNGGGTWWIVIQHLLPGNFSYIIVALTLAIPNMILGETALSFLGLGIRPPMVSWGTLLQTSQDINVVATQSWVVVSAAVPIILAVLAFNFVGDGLRDATDPGGRS